MTDTTTTIDESGPEFDSENSVHEEYWYNTNTKNKEPLGQLFSGEPEDFVWSQPEHFGIDDPNMDYLDMLLAAHKNGWVFIEQFKYGGVDELLITCGKFSEGKEALSQIYGDLNSSYVCIYDNEDEAKEFNSEMEVWSYLESKEI